MSKVNWLFGSIALIKSQNYKHARSSGIKEKDARKIAFAPHLNIGVFFFRKRFNVLENLAGKFKKNLIKR